MWGAKTGLLDLASRRREYRAISNLILNPREGKRGALDCAQAALDKTVPDMAPFLKDLAQKGYAHFIKRDDQRVVMATERDVCAVVMDDAIAPSLTADWLKEKPDASQVAVVTNQATRLLLAKELRAIGEVPQLSNCKQLA